jgi:hypothetical protein
MNALARKALEHAFFSIEGHEDPLIPFVMVERADGVDLLRLVVNDSAAAQSMGRKLARERAPHARGYALAYEGYLRLSGERKDAMIVEAAMAGEGAAQVVAQIFERGKSCARLGEPLVLPAIPSALEPVDPFSLGWGGITPDIVSRDNVAIHVINHALGTGAEIERTVRFVRARMKLFRRALPPEMPQAIMVDDRGRELALATKAQLRKELGAESAFVKFTTDGV